MFGNEGSFSINQIIIDIHSVHNKLFENISTILKNSSPPKEVIEKFEFRKKNILLIKSLSQFFDYFISSNDNMNDGKILLGWITLGALIEANLSIFLFFYLQDFNNSNENKSFKNTPESMSLGKMIEFFKENNVFVNIQIDESLGIKEIENKNIFDFISFVSSKRNCIHFMNKQSLPNDLNEFINYLRKYLDFIIEIEGRISYLLDFDIRNYI